jgi:hypothetical protein
VNKRVRNEGKKNGSKEQREEKIVKHELATERMITCKL